jgi:hypothetical protein
MPGSFRNTFWTRCVLALIVLAANIGAPFRTSALGRVLLESLRQNPATASVVRVRAISSAGASQGFRVVVGLARGGSDETDRAASFHGFSGFLLSLTGTLPLRLDDRPIARPHPFLRC